MPWTHCYDSFLCIVLIYSQKLFVSPINLLVADCLCVLHSTAAVLFLGVLYCFFFLVTTIVTLLPNYVLPSPFLQSATQYLLPALVLILSMFLMQEFTSIFSPSSPLLVNVKNLAFSVFLSLRLFHGVSRLGNSIYLMALRAFLHFSFLRSDI